MKSSARQNRAGERSQQTRQMLPNIAKNADQPMSEPGDYVGSGLSYQTSSANHKRTSMFRQNANVNPGANFHHVLEASAIHHEATLVGSPNPKKQQPQASNQADMRYIAGRLAQQSQQIRLTGGNIAAGTMAQINMQPVVVDTTGQYNTKNVCMTQSPLNVGN